LIMVNSTATHLVQPGSTGWDAVQLHPADSVAVALRDLSQGHEATIHGPNALRRVVLAEPIAMGHKLALASMAAGSKVLKYGEAIGQLTADVAIGEHVHVHNLVSCRARPRTR
jgi:hypothetical protein